MATKICSLVTYVTKEGIQNALEKKKNQIVSAYYICHDRDTNEDGTKVEKHYHVNLLLRKSREANEIRNWFKGYCDEKGQEANTLWKEVTYPKEADLYLTHETEKAIAEEKVKYNQEEIAVIIGERSDFTEFRTERMKEEGAIDSWEKKADNIEQMLDDINNKVPLRTMARIYGRDFIRNYKNYKEFANQMKKEEQQNGNQD